MNKRQKLTLFLAGLLVVMLGAFGWLLIRSWLPVNPAKPYFPDQWMRIGPGRWEVGRFQPVFLFSFSRDNTPFFKVAYRDASATIRLMDIQVGLNLAGGRVLAAVVKSNQKVLEPKTLSDYAKYIKFGQRFGISYVRNAEKRAGINYSQVYPPGSPEVTDFCSRFPYECEAARITLEAGDSYLDFEQAKVFVGKPGLVGLYINLDLLSQ